MDFGQLKYNVVETIGHKGVWYFIWRAALVALIIWWVWPEPDAVIKHKVADTAVDLADEPKDWHQFAQSSQDLRKIITTSQSTFYWESFNWMMEYGVAERPRSFESRVINIRFLMSDIFQTKDKRSCRSFREKMVVAGKANHREGVACKRQIADWCKQVKGEKIKCRSKKSQGIDSLKDDVFDAHNLNIKLNRNLQKLPSF